MSQENDDALEKLAMEEILKEAKRNADRAKEMGSLGWQKPNISTNKRFLNNMLVSTLRHPIRRTRKFSNDSKKKGDYQDRIEPNSSESKRDKRFERKHSSDYDQDPSILEKESDGRYHKIPVKRLRGKQHQEYDSGFIGEWDPPLNGIIEIGKPPINFEEVYHDDYMEYIENYKKHMEFYSEMEKRTQHQLEFRVKSADTRRRTKSRFEPAFSPNDLDLEEALDISDEFSAEKYIQCTKLLEEKDSLSLLGDDLTSESKKSSERKRKRETRKSSPSKKTKLESVVLKTKSKRKHRKSDKKEKKSKRKSKTGRRISIAREKKKGSCKSNSPEKMKLIVESDLNKDEQPQTINVEKRCETEEVRKGSNSEKDNEKKKRKRVKHKKSSSRRRHKRHRRTKSGIS